MQTLTLSPGYFRKWRIIPEVRGDDVRVLAAAMPESHVLDDLRWVFGLNVVVDLIAPELLDAAIEQAEHEIEDTAAGLIASLDIASPVQVEDAIWDGDLMARVQEAPVVRLVNLLLLEALEANASDVHIECGRGIVAVRYRIDGVLLDAPSPPAALAPAVVGRLKVMAEMDVAERRRPQDGRIRLRLDGRAVDVRVSTLPTLNGESVVLRLLESEGRRLSIADLGMADDARCALEQLLASPHGVLLTTGPTGSGKTTTLYAALERIRSGHEKIITVEDPVEFARH